MSINPIDSLHTAEADVLRAIRDLRFGAVEVTVHDGRIVQVETREKVRFDAAGRRSPESRRREKETRPRPDRTFGGSGTAGAEETTR
jgi:hypothetical protein